MGEKYKKNCAKSVRNMFKKILIKLSKVFKKKKIIDQNNIVKICKKENK
jgi:hypothetical protein